MLRYVNYEPAKHAGQAVYTIRAGELSEGVIPVNVREVTTKAELVAAQQDPFGYVVLADVAVESREVNDARVRRASE